MPDRESSGAETVRNPVFARLYMWMSRRRNPDEEGHRGRLLEGVRGRVIELGAGSGLNFRHYPESVDEVIAVEPEPSLREAAVEEAAKAPVRIEVRDGVAGRIPLEDASCDVGIASLVLCSVPDQRQALAELRRVIRPGGELRFYEHVIGRRPLTVRWMRVADATLWPRIAGGCHLTRDTTAAIADAGFEIAEIDRFPFSPAAALPAIPHILGVARRPAD